MRLESRCGWPALIAATLALGGCAASSAQKATLTASPLAGAYTVGTIIAVRDTVAATGTGGLARVLAALNQPSDGSPVAQELVIRRADRSVTSLVQAAPSGAPPFHAGEIVAIITASDTVVRRE